MNREYSDDGWREYLLRNSAASKYTCMCQRVEMYKCMHKYLSWHFTIWAANKEHIYTLLHMS